MSLIDLILGIVVIGVALWAINKWIPMEPRIKNFLNVVVIILLIAWVLYITGVFARLNTIRVPSIAH